MTKPRFTDQGSWMTESTRVRNVFENAITERLNRWQIARAIARHGLVKVDQVVRDYFWLVREIHDLGRTDQQLGALGRAEQRKQSVQGLMQKLGIELVTGEAWVNCTRPEQWQSLIALASQELGEDGRLQKLAVVGSALDPSDPRSFQWLALVELAAVHVEEEPKRRGTGLPSPLERLARAWNALQAHEVHPLRPDEEADVLRAFREFDLPLLLRAAGINPELLR